VTTEKVHRIELGDVRRVSIECRECHVVIAVPASGWGVQFKCPQCNAPWAPTGTPAHAALYALAQGFNGLTQRDAELKFTIRLEVDAE
jgi:hypothetical protein